METDFAVHSSRVQYYLLKREKMEVVRLHPPTVLISAMSHKVVDKLQSNTDNCHLVVDRFHYIVGHPKEITADTAASIATSLSNTVIIMIFAVKK